MTFRLVLPFLALAATLLAGRWARADLVEDLDAVEQAWKSRAEVDLVGSRLLSHGETWPVLLPPEALDVRLGGCTTVVVLGAVSTGFLVRMFPQEGGRLAWRDLEPPEASVGGAVELSRCGQRKRSLRGLAIEMRSPRGVLAVLVVRAARPVTGLRTILTHREPGVVATSIPPGPRPSTAPLGDRVARIEARVQREGAQSIDRRLLRADEDGGGHVLLALDEGCHDLHVLGVSQVSDARSLLDVDAELRWASSGELVSADRTDASDARVTACVGERRAAVLAFVGAVPGVPVLIVHARWVLPAGVPAAWGPEARARVTRALRRQLAVSPPDSPVYESLGVAGVTTLPLELEPGACYLATAVALRGATNVLGLTASVGVRRAHGHSQDAGEAALLAFCAEGGARGSLEVEAHGHGVAWLAALWQMGRVPIGVPVR